jgi:ubiquitin carboxyl-terminal hydrolase L3
MSTLASSLGVSPALGFHDVYSLSDPDLLSFIPRPVYALIFLCPASIYHRARDAEHDAMPTYTACGPSEPVIWFKQTIGHACGLIALLHGLANGGAKAYITPDSTLDGLLKMAVGLKPTARAQLLYDSAELEAAHMAAAVRGDTVAPDAREENYQHFICFVKAEDGHLWELNGGMKGPVDRGVLGGDEDALSERALALGVKSFLDLLGKSGEGEREVNFSLVAMAPGFD